ncbi:MAG TPA: MFS transporter [Anaerolineae bacterium]|nr:MFS transporter [Anaerolineae bacterium]
MDSQLDRELEPAPVSGIYEVVEAPEQPNTNLTSASHLPSIWRNRDYMLLWSGQVVSVIGTGASQIVYPLLILALTNSPAAAGIASALASLPYIIFSLPAGALIDRWDRKRVMIYCDIGRALVLASIPVALALNALTIWQIYIASLVEGSLFVFFNLAEVAALSRVVTKEQLPQAAAQNDAAFSIAGILAPSVGTILYQFGKAIPFLFDSFSYMVSVISLLFIKAEFQLERKRTELHLVQEIHEGLDWLWHQPLVRYMAFLTGGLNFVNAATTLIIIVLAKNLGASDAEIGLVFSLSAIGAIAGSIIGGQIQRRFRFGQVIISTVWISAILFPLLAIAPQFYLLGIIQGLAWMTGPIYNVVQFSYRIALIPDALQGRVNSTFRLLAFGFQPLGAALGGFLIERYGVNAAVLFFTVWYLIISVLTTFNSHVRNAKPLEQAQAAL